MADYVNKREYERYPVSLKVQVSGMDEQGGRFNDAASLKDISGGGANLLTEHAEHYFLGQKVDIRISLPGSDKFNAEMNGHGMVVWMSEDSKHPDKNDCASIGLSMNDLLAFEHLIEAGNNVSQ